MTYQKENPNNKQDLSVWNEDANTGLDTIRKILLSKHLAESEQKMVEMNRKYEKLFYDLNERLQARELQHAQKMALLEAAFQQKVDELRTKLSEQIVEAEKKIITQTESKTTNFGKVLIQLGKEWSLGRSNGTTNE